MESYQRKKLVAFFCFKNRDLLKSYCNKRIRKVIINDNGWQEVIHSLEKRRNPHEPTRNIHIHPKAIPRPSRHHHQIRIPRHHLQKPKNCRTLCHLLPISRKNNFHGSSGRAGHDRQLHRNVPSCSGKAHGSEALAGSSAGRFCQRFKSSGFTRYELRPRRRTGRSRWRNRSR